MDSSSISSATGGDDRKPVARIISRLSARPSGCPSKLCTDVSLRGENGLTVELCAVSAKGVLTSFPALGFPFGWKEGPTQVASPVSDTLAKDRSPTGRTSSETGWEDTGTSVVDKLLEAPPMPVKGTTFSRPAPAGGLMVGRSEMEPNLQAWIGWI